MTSWYFVRFPTYFNLIHLCESKRQEGRKIFNLKKRVRVSGSDSLWVRYACKSINSHRDNGLQSFQILVVTVVKPSSNSLEHNKNSIKFPNKK